MIHGQRKTSQPDRLKKTLDIQTRSSAFMTLRTRPLFEPLVSPGREPAYSLSMGLGSRAGPPHHKGPLRLRRSRTLDVGIELRSRKEFLEFLVDGEGLQGFPRLMEKWIDAAKPYRAQNPHLFLGPAQG